MLKIKIIEIFHLCFAWRVQISIEIGAKLSQDFGCIKFKEISTKETVDEVGEVFESALRQGWLFRQHRELTKHRNLTLYTSSTSSASASSAPSSANTSLERTCSLDNSGSFDWWDAASASGLQVPASPSAYLGTMTSAAAASAANAAAHDINGGISPRPFFDGFSPSMSIVNYHSIEQALC